MPVDSRKRTHAQDDNSRDQPTVKARRRSSVAAGPPGPSSRTGQACDRCKSRKIRCDDTEGGCLPCRLNNVECTTTDRVSNRVFARGHTENLERQCSTLRQHVSELQSQLKSHGIEPKLSVAIDSPIKDETMYRNDMTLTPSEDTPDARTYQHHRSTDSNVFALPQSRKDHSPPRNTVASSTTSVLSQIKGTSMTIFGMEINLADYMPENEAFDEDGDSPMSHNFWHKHVYRLMPKEPPKIPLPTWEEHRFLLFLYLDLMHPLIPIVHKPDFMNMVQRVHSDPTFTPSLAEEVVIQIVLAFTRYVVATFSSPNERGTATSESFTRYRWCLWQIPAITSEWSMAGMQAIVLTNAFIKMFPRPGPSWSAGIMAQTILVSWNVHRNPKIESDKTASWTEHERHMASRCWHSHLTLHATVAPRLGLPVCLGRLDFDVEVPEPVDDRLPEEMEDPNASVCSWQPMIRLYKLVTLALDAYVSLYTVRPTSQTDYERHLERLTDRWRGWTAELPKNYNNPSSKPSKNDADEVTLLWKLRYQFMGGIFKILLHHPALCRTPNPKFLNQNIEMCMQGSNDVIEAQGEMQRMQRIDPSWTNVTSYINAVLAQLFCCWERRKTLKADDINNVRKKLNRALDIMTDVGDTLGPGVGVQIRDRTRSIITVVLNHISAGDASLPPSTPTPTPPQPPAVTSPKRPHVRRASTTQRIPRRSESEMEYEFSGLSPEMPLLSRVSSAPSGAIPTVMRPYANQMHGLNYMQEQQSQQSYQGIQNHRDPSTPHSATATFPAEYPDSSYNYEHFYMGTAAAQVDYSTGPFAQMQWMPVNGPGAWQRFVETFRDPFTMQQQQQQQPTPHTQAETQTRPIATAYYDQPTGTSMSSAVHFDQTRQHTPHHARHSSTTSLQHWPPGFSGYQPPPP